MLGDKILIIGSPGAGKSFLSRTLARTKQLPLYHLDDLYWKEGWKRTSKADWTQFLNELCRENKWVIDGNYFESIPLRLEHADSVIYLDLPTLTCLQQALTRALRRLFGQKETLPIKIRLDESYTPRLKFSYHFFMLILSFKVKIRPKILKLLSNKRLKYYQRIRSKKELTLFLSQFNKE